ncbi:hypothetical protein DRQ25_05245 [Candidatus Fermentibacteria bacterium]|nr:MAG: hypothetical protein DRQ25_05245 [Candidatus Fermentibacteria bacterium]
MSKISKGWVRGLAEGYENSGWFIGTFMPIGIFCLIVAAIIFAFTGVPSCERPVKIAKPCTDYSYKLGRGYARCTQWPAMEVRVDKRWVKADIVHCKCTEESYATAEVNHD